MRRIKVHVTTGWANGDHIDYFDLPDNWEDLSEEDQEEYLYECAKDYLHEVCDTHACVVDEDESE